MKLLFADTFYWVALLNPQDEDYTRVKLFSRLLASTKLITTEEVLTEVLTFFASYGSFMRQKAGQFVRDIISDPMIRVIPQTHDSFTLGFMLYEQRLDKEYSLQDCISMQIMRQLGITEILTHDKHFTQEGFTILLG
jgi:predicted nucleic acid-binding protein